MVSVWFTTPVVTALLLPAWSQRADRPRRVGVLLPWLSSDLAKRPPVLQALVDGLREHGWEEGRNERCSLAPTS